MTTKIIGLKNFRQHISSYTQTAQKKNVRYIVLRKNIPVLEVKSIDEKKFVLEHLEQELTEARAQVKAGQVYTQDEVLKEFGLL